MTGLRPRDIAALPHDLDRKQVADLLTVDYETFCTCVVAEATRRVPRQLRRITPTLGWYMATEQGEPGVEHAGADRRIVPERLRAAAVVAVAMASGCGYRNDTMAAMADQALLDQIDQARVAGWSWDDVDAALRYVSPRAAVGRCLCLYTGLH